MRIGVPNETARGEKRVALTPDAAALLVKQGFEIAVETGAGDDAHYPDSQYKDKGAAVVSREEVLKHSEILLHVGLLSNPSTIRANDFALLPEGQVVIGLMNPLGNPHAMEELAKSGATGFALELLPRITRAQSMDVLSSMATCSGYKAVLLAASALPRFFPMFMTAAGTVQPAHVFVIGAGVAGLQAIATSRKLGAVVHAYDVRPAVKQEVESLGAKFVELPLETAEGSGGYAKAMDAAFYAKQRELMKSVIVKSDVVITTASVPGKKAPVLVTKDMVEGMQSGSLIVDLAAEQGGNCELTEAGETKVHNGVQIIGPVNLPSSIAHHASQLYAKNVSTFVQNLVKGGKLHIDLEDEIIRETLVTRGGEVVHPRVKELLV